MKRLHIIGDLQYFSHLNEWSDELTERIYEYFNHYNFGVKEDNDLLFLGDITEKANNYGNVIKNIARLFNTLSRRVRNIYILVGNHDIKTINDKETISFEFLEEFTNIKIIKTETILNWENLKICCLPFKKIKEKSLDDYYTNDLPDEYYNTEFDLICGHTALLEDNSFLGGIDINKFKFKNAAFGHIHTRSGKWAKYYTGSVAPLKINEYKDNKLPRVIKVLYDDGKIIETELPSFVEYSEVEFPNKIIKEENFPIKIYTIKNCSNLDQAKEFYNGFYIRTIERPQKENNITKEKGKIFTNLIQAYDEMIKEKQITIKRTTDKYIRELLKI